MNFKNISTRVLRRFLLPLLPARHRLPFKLWLYLRDEKQEAELSEMRERFWGAIIKGN